MNNTSAELGICRATFLIQLDILLTVELTINANFFNSEVSKINGNL